MNKMLRAITHRGPDDEGSAAVDEGRTALGNTRLAIQDLSHSGHQPMHDASTGNWIVLNGEIYNHLEVRNKLRDRIEKWHSSCDTETVLRAYSVWGAGCLEHLRGMFAMAIWDSARQDLWCARDRLGIKPFYYWQSGDTTVFGSEVRSILSSCLVPKRIEPDGLAGYIRFGAVPEPFTLIDGIRSLPPGHSFRIARGKVSETTRYWKPPQYGDPIPPGKAAKLVRAELERSLSEHLISDVPVASFLSGGVDSSIVTALAASFSSRPVQSVTFGFNEAEFDESRHAQTVATRYKTDHRSILLSESDVAGLVPAAVAAMDLPSSDGVNTYVVSKAAAAAGNKVVLSGLGGDEIFGGYKTFNTLLWASRLSGIPRGMGVRVARRLSKTEGAAQRLEEMLSPASMLSARYESLRSFWSAAQLRSLGVNRMIGYGTSGTSSHQPQRKNLKTQIAWLEMSGYMLSTLLRDGDSMSMANSLEMRVPFLDHRLVECCLRLGAAEYSGRNGRKKLLLAAAGDLLPKGFGRRKKQGFVLPMQRWMRTSLALYVTEGLANLRNVESFAGFEVTALNRKFLSGELSWPRLWQFVVLGHWAKQNL